MSSFFFVAPLGWAKVPSLNVTICMMLTSHFQQKAQYSYIMYVPCNSIKAIYTRIDSIGVSCDIAGDSLSTRTHLNYEKQDGTRLSNIITGYYLHSGLSCVPCLVLHLRADNRSWCTMQSCCFFSETCTGQ